MLPSFGATPPPILKHLIYLTNRETERAKDENRNHLSMYINERVLIPGAGRVI